MSDINKPSYEELPMNRREAYLRGYEAGKRENESELTRVRGLLQRATDLLQRVEHSRGITLGQLPKDVHEFLANEGAESADIGKLDAADESKLKDLLQRLLWVEELFNVHFFAGESVGAAIKRVLAGSAETGGEK